MNKRSAAFLLLTLAVIAAGVIGCNPGGIKSNRVTNEAMSKTAPSAVVNRSNASLVRNDSGIRDMNVLTCYNVKKYGAASDGTTDDSEYIQNAINDCNSHGGGIVYFPGGTYRINTTVTPANNITLFGAGAIIKRGSNITMFNVGDTNNVTFRNLIIDGNGASTRGRIFRGSGTILANFTIDHCTIKNQDSGNYAFYTSRTVNGFTIANSKWFNCGAGIAFDLDTGNTVSNILIQGNDMRGLANPNGCFLVFQTTDNAIRFSNVRVANNYVYGTAGTGSSGMAINNSDGATIIGNVFDTHRIALGCGNGRNVTVSGNIFKNFGAAAAGYAIECGGSLSQNVSITGNAIYNNSTSSDVLLGILFNAGAKNVVISGNTLDSSARTTSSIDNGIDVRDINNVNISDNTLVDWGNKAITASGGWSTPVVSSTFANISNNLIKTSRAGADPGARINLSRVNNSTITNNTLYADAARTSYSGWVHFQGCDNLDIFGNNFKSDTSQQNAITATGTSWKESTNIRIHNNYFYNFGYGYPVFGISTNGNGTGMASSLIVIENNRFEKCSTLYAVNSGQRIDRYATEPNRGIFKLGDTAFNTAATTGRPAGWQCIHSAQTTVKTDLSATGTKLYINSTSGMNASDNIGIELDNKAFHWTIINGAPASDGGGTYITLTDGIPASRTAPAGGYVGTMLLKPQANLQ